MPPPPPARARRHRRPRRPPPPRSPPRATPRSSPSDGASTLTARSTSPSETSTSSACTPPATKVPTTPRPPPPHHPPPPSPSTPSCCASTGVRAPTLSWAPAARALARRLGPSRVVAAVDLRGHGETRCGERLRAGRRHARRGPRRRRRRAPPTIRIQKNRGRERTRTEASTCVFLVGHSAGGAAAVRAASSSFVDEAARRSRASRWSTPPRARVSPPSRACAANLAAGVRPESRLRTRRRRVGATRGSHAKRGRRARLRPLAELRAPRPGDDDASEGPSSSASVFAWRTSLAATRPHWRGWFEGVSRAFLAAPCPKLLVLAGVDRLDDELVVAQMSGSFRRCSSRFRGTPCRFEPERVADAVAAFVRRYAGATRVGNGLYARTTR